jgi:hypothetical protein
MNIILSIPDEWVKELEDWRGKMGMRSRQEVIRWAIQYAWALKKLQGIGPDTTGWPIRERHVDLCPHCVKGEHAKHLGQVPGHPEVMVQGPPPTSDEHVIWRWVCHCAQCGYVAPAAEAGRPAVTA